jgi:multidrug resistance efflux pump
MNKKFRIAIVLLSLGLLVSACGSAANSAATPEAVPTAVADDTIIAEGRLEPIHYAEIAFSASGTVSDVLAKEGQAVKKGDVLVRLGDATDTNYAAAQLELATAQQALNDLQDTAGSDLAQTIIDLKEAREEQKKAENYLSYLENTEKIPQTNTEVILVQTWRGYQYEYRKKNIKGPAPEDWIVEAKNDLALDTARVDELERAYSRMKDGMDTDQLAVLEARLNAAKAKVDAFSVTAPFDGVVADMNAKVGDSINAGEIAITVADFSAWVVKTTDVTEIDVVNLAEGQPVSITFDAFPDQEVNGNIVSIGQTYTENQGDVVYEVTVMLADTDPSMRWGMTAAVQFAED